MYQSNKLGQLTHVSMKRVTVQLIQSIILMTYVYFLLRMMWRKEMPCHHFFLNFASENVIRKSKENCMELQWNEAHHLLDLQRY